MNWVATPIWKGERCFILGGGPSLKGFDASVLRGKGRVLVVNDSWRLAPWFDCLYFTDPTWYQQQLGFDRWALDMSINFGQIIYKRMLVNGDTGSAFAEHPQVRQLKFSGAMGLETDPAKLRHGCNSVYAAMNLAYHFGVNQIVLLGVDMRIIPGQRTHWHDEERANAPTFADIIKQSMLPKFQTLAEPLKAAGVEVLNATPESALTVWPLVALEDILNPKEHQNHVKQHHTVQA